MMRYSICVCVYELHTSVCGTCTTIGVCILYIMCLHTQYVYIYIYIYIYLHMILWYTDYSHGHAVCTCPSLAAASPPAYLGATNGQSSCVYVSVCMCVGCIQTVRIHVSMYSQTACTYMCRYVYKRVDFMCLVSLNCTYLYV